jgi:hypothetical protein
MPATKIMIIRHAEKPTTNPPTNGVTISGTPDKDSLIPLGWQRAGALVTLFDPARGPLQNSDLATPQSIFATSTSDTEGNRPEETITPLAKKLGVTPNISIANSQLDAIVTEAINSFGVVLICWPHGEIPNLIKLIPRSTRQDPSLIPSGWPGDRFDMVFVFDLDTTSPGIFYMFSQVPQLLLYGDSPNLFPGSSS